MANLKLTIDEALARIEELKVRTLASFHRDCEGLTMEFAEGLAYAEGPKKDPDVSIASAAVAVLFSDIEVDHKGQSNISLEVNGRHFWQDRLTIPTGRYIALVLLKEKAAP